MTVESCSSCHPAYTGKSRGVQLNAARKFFDKYKGYSSQIGAGTGSDQKDASQSKDDKS